MRIFKSGLRNRIELAITILESDLRQVCEEKKLFMQFKSTQKLCGAIVREREIEEKIKLLKDLL